MTLTDKKIKKIYETIKEYLTNKSKAELTNASFNKDVEICEYCGSIKLKTYVCPVCKEPDGEKNEKS